MVKVSEGPTVVRKWSKQISHKQSGNCVAISINSQKRKVLKKTVCNDNYLSDCIYMSDEDEGQHDKSM